MSWIDISKEVKDAIAVRRPVVALESTLITHGLPYPRNLEVARRMEEVVITAGAMPATIGVLNGRARVGLNEAELEELARSNDAKIIIRRDLAAAITMNHSGGTTVATTMIIARAANIAVFATGGIGGIHAGIPGYVSADLTELARTPVIVVSAGAKYFLDLERTLLFLETAGVPVLGWKTDRVPAFFVATSDFPVSVRVESAEEVASMATTHWSIGLQSGLLVTALCPEHVAVPQEIAHAAMVRAEQEAQAEGLKGKPLTPFMLRRMAELTNDQTLRANIELLYNNATIAAKIANSLARS